MSSTAFTPFQLTFGNNDLFLEQNCFQKYVNDHNDKIQTLYNAVAKKSAINEAEVIYFVTVYYLIM